MAAAGFLIGYYAMINVYFADINGSLKPILISITSVVIYCGCGEVIFEMWYI